MKQKKTYLLALIPFLVLCVLFELIPIIYTIIRSFVPEGEDFGFTLANYINIFTKPLYQKAIVNSLIISILSSIIGLIVAFIGAKAVHESVPSSSRTLRMLEQEGLAVRETDPQDRRKTRVRITPKGEADRLACEQAMGAFWDRVTQRLGPQRLAQLCEGTGYLLDAMEAELNESAVPRKGESHAEDL